MYILTNITFHLHSYDNNILIWFFFNNVKFIKHYILTPNVSCLFSCFSNNDSTVDVQFTRQSETKIG